MAKYIFLLGVWLSAVPLLSAQPRPANGRVNENYVWLFTSSGKLEKLFPLKAPVFENRNGLVNVSIANDKNDLFQVNGIPEGWLKDTVVRKCNVQLVFMRDSGTWSSRKKSTEIHISCKSRVAGKPLRIRVISTIYQNKGSYRTEAQFNGTVPVKQSVSTNKQ